MVEQLEGVVAVRAELAVERAEQREDLAVGALDAREALVHVVEGEPALLQRAGEPLARPQLLQLRDVVLAEVVDPQLARVRLRLERLRDLELDVEAGQHQRVDDDRAAPVPKLRRRHRYSPSGK